MTEETLKNYEPTTIDEMSSVPTWDEDAGVWYMSYHGLGVEGGEITTHTCDSDGSWETDGEGVKATNDNLSAESDKLYKEHTEANKKYDEYCAEHGEDPLHMYYVHRHDHHEGLFQATITTWEHTEELGLKLVEVKDLSGPEPVVLDMDNLPKHVHEYLLLDREHDTWFIDGIITVKDIADVDASVLPRKDGDPVVVNFPLKWKTPRDPEKIKQDIITIAKRKT